MRRISIAAVLALVLALVAGPGSVLASSSPHFIGTPTVTKSLTSGLTASGKAAGLANEPTGAFLTADTVTATYDCVNKGGNIAPGQPVVLQNVTGPTQSIAPHNGQITFTATLPPPPTPSSKTECPNGNWSVMLTSLTYSNVVLHIQQDSVDLLTWSFGTVDP